jgi:hypothetical protein
MLTLGKLRSRVGKMKNASYGGGAMTAKGKAQVKRAISELYTIVASIQPDSKSDRTWEYFTKDMDKVFYHLGGSNPHYALQPLVSAIDMVRGAEERRAKGMSGSPRQRSKKGFFARLLS